MRHPPADIAPGVCYGRLDLDLAAGAEMWIARISSALAGLGAPAIWTSPARRCRAVAEAIGADAVPDARLLELDFGRWEGRPWRERSRDELDRWAASPGDFAAPGGETGNALLQRVSAFHAMLAGTTGDAIVVAHGGPLKLLQCLLCGRPVDWLATAQPLGTVRLFSMPPREP